MCSLILANSARNESELQRHFLSNHLSILCLLLFCPQSLIYSSECSSKNARMYTVSYAPKMLLSSIFSAHFCPQSSAAILPQNASRRERNGKMNCII